MKRLYFFIYLLVLIIPCNVDALSLKPFSEDGALKPIEVNLEKLPDTGKYRLKGTNPNRIPIHIRLDDVILVDTQPTHIPPTGDIIIAPSGSITRNLRGTCLDPAIPEVSPGTIPSGGRLNIKEYDLTETSQPPGGPIRRAMDEAAVVSDTLSPGGRLNAGEIDQTVTSTRATQRSSQAMDENSVVTDTKPSNG